MNAPLILSAVEGYLLLDMLGEAEAELCLLEEEHADALPTRRMRLLILMRRNQWREAASLAAELCELDSDNADLYIQHALCLHEIGRTEDAIKRLVHGPSSLRRSPVFYYNLGCYHARLGRLADAAVLLRQSFRMDRRLADFALKDPDLKPMRDKLTAI